MEKPAICDLFTCHCQPVQGAAHAMTAIRLPEGLAAAQVRFSNLVLRECRMGTLSKHILQNLGVRAGAPEKARVSRHLMSGREVASLVSLSLASLVFCCSPQDELVCVDH